jgi:hypothetical protein
MVGVQTETKFFMRRFFLLLLFIFLFNVVYPTQAQTVNSFDGTYIYWNQNGLQRTSLVPVAFPGAAGGPCTSQQLAINTLTGTLYSCNNGSWIQVGNTIPASLNLLGSNVNQQIVNEESDLGTLTYNASGTTTFAAASVFVAGGKVTVTHSSSTTFSPTGLVKWGSYTLEIIEDATGGGVTFTLGTGGTCSVWKVRGGGAGAITLSSVASAIDILTFTYDGTNCLASLGPNYN